MAVLTNTMLQGTAADTGDGDESYDIEKSIRFNSDDDAYLLYRPTTQGNRRVWTWSGWLKRSKPGVIQRFFGTDGSDTWSNDDLIDCRIEADDRLTVAVASTQWRTTAQEFRDPSAWFHVVLTCDTTHITADDRIKIWINGSQVLDFDTKNNPTLNQLQGPGRAVAYHRVGAGYSVSNSTWEGNIADVHFIDGLALNPASFGTFDSTGVWNPKAFILPAPNKGVTHSSTLVPSINGNTVGFQGGDAVNAFDGYVVPGTTANWANVLSSNAGEVVKMTYTPASAIAAPSILRVFTYTGDAGDPVYIIFNGNGRTKSLEDLGYANGAAAWVDVTELLPAGEDLTSIAVERTANGSGDGSPIGAIEVDGIILIDGKNDPTARVNPNDGQEYSSGTEAGTAMNSSNDADNAFDGSLTTSNSMVAANNSTYSVTLPSPVTVKYNVRLRCHQQAAGTKAKAYITPTGGSSTAYSSADTFATAKWVNVFTGTGELTKLEVNSDSSGDKAGIQAVEVDGHVLVDKTVDNSYNLKFNDTSRNSALGKDSLNGKIADATGGLPFYNTSDTYGATKGSGYRTDSSAGTTDGTGLVLALPGDVLTDEHDHVNTGSSAVTVTNSGAAVSTAESQFYGSSLKFDGSNDYLTVGGSSDFAFGTGDFTIEFWLRSNEATPNNKDIFSNPGGIQLFFVSGKLRYNHATVAGLLDTDNVIPKGQWIHFALVRSSGTTRWYVDGVQNAGSYSDSKNWTQTTSWYVGSYNGSSQHSDIFLNDLRVYKAVAKYTANFKPPARNDFTVNSLDHASSTGTITGGSWSTAFKTGANVSFNGGTDWVISSGSSVATNGNLTRLLVDTGGLGDSYELVIEDTGGANDIYYTANGDPSSNSFSLVENNISKLIITPSGIDSDGTFRTDVGRYLRLEGSGGGHCTMTVTGVLDLDAGTSSHPNLDTSVDSPTNYGTDTGVGGEVRGNYCTWNHLDWQDTSKIKLSNGNLTTYRTDSGWYSGRGTFGMTSGKWYFECTAGTNFSAAINYNVGQIGIAKGGITGELGVTAGGYMYYNHSGNKMTGDSGGTNASYGSTWSNGDVIGVAFDADNGKIWWAKNGTWAASGNPAAGSNEAFSGLTDGPYFPAVSQYSSVSPSYLHTNFGQRPFKYTAPSGFKALCTQNLDDTFSGTEVNNPSKYFDVIKFTGVGATVTRNNFNFQPDLVWFKARNHTHGHEVYDSVRGVTKGIYPHLNNIEGTESAGLTAFTSKGFTTGDGGWVNDSGKTYVTWGWDAGTAANTSGLTDGSIDISSGNQWINSTAGFSITKYTGNGTAAADFSHGLAVPPELIIIKNLDQNDGWSVAHKGSGTTGDNVGGGSVPEWYMLYLNESNSRANWSGDTCAPSGNNKIAIGDGHQVNANNENYICYAWTPIKGYSAFGSYEGNDADPGPFIWTGFRPKFVLIKNVDANDSWTMLDTARNKYNEVYRWLNADSNADENTTENNNSIDIVSNGFRIRGGTTTNDATNGPNETISYAAWAAHPFKTARAF